jgi:RNA polymerase sigma factor (sigma-70 family)
LSHIGNVEENPDEWYDTKQVALPATTIRRGNNDAGVGGWSWRQSQLGCSRRPIQRIDLGHCPRVPAGLVERLDRLHNPARVGCWLATTARHECLRILNANKREVPIGDDVGEQESLAPQPGESLLQTERDEAIRGVFSLLSAKDQALLRLLTAEPSLRYSEIAAALGIPIGSVGPTRQRALDRLRRLLESRGVMTQLAECGGRR